MDTPLSWPTLVHLLRWRAEQQPDRTGYVFLEDGEREAGRLTYGELLEEIIAMT